MEISKCQCGGDNSGIDWLPVTELKSGAFQTCFIHCVDCEVEVSFEINADKENDINNFEDRLVDLWNLINKE